MKFKPDYNNLLNSALNKKPQRIPLYEHGISDEFMERITGIKFSHLIYGDDNDLDIYFKNYCGFFLENGYDTVSFEAGVTQMLPFGGALAHPKPGYIDSVEKFENYPFDSVKGIYIQRFEKYFNALARNMPEGMKAVGGVGNGVFEIAQDLCGYENLCVMSFEEPELYCAVFKKIGKMLLEIWEWFLNNHAKTYCVCRFGDDLGYKSNTMLSHKDIKNLIIPEYKKIVELIHFNNKPFLLHSCGCIFEVMDDLIKEAKIDAKHSNEDQIAPMKVWIEKYGQIIGNFGGIDTDVLVRMNNEKLVKYIKEIYKLAENKKGGFAIGSGNSIPNYVNIEKYLLMINTVTKLRGDY